MTIVEALKLTKFKKRSRCNLANIKFDTIEIRDVKNLPTSFDGDILFVLPHIALGVPSAYG